MTTRSSTDFLITVREVLSLPVVKRGVPEVVTDDEGLDAQVRWVHSAEVSYIAKLLRGGELLLMTGIGIGGSEQEQRRLVDELAQQKIAALAIELGTRFRAVPRAIVSEAERRGLPLIAFHHEIPFVEVTEAVHREIVNRQAEAMRRGNELHHQFTSLILEGAGVPEVVAEVARTVGCAVVLEKEDEGVLYHVAYRTDDRTLLAAWDAFTRGLEGAPPAVVQPVPTGREESWGRLVAMGVDAPLAPDAQVALERAAGVIALALLRDREEEAVGSRWRGHFLIRLLEREVDEVEARQRAADLGFANNDEPMLPIVVGPSAALSLRSSASENALWSLLWRDLRRELSAQGIPMISGTRDHGRELMIALGLRCEAARAETADRVVAALSEAGARHFGVAGVTVICVGPVVESWTELGAGLRTAAEALPAATHGRERAWHDVTVPDVDRLLWLMRDQPELQHFADARLGPLIEHDDHRSTKLLPTLMTYCEHFGRKAETARALHIERQSLYHRLSRIEELLGADLSDGDAVLGLHLAAWVHLRLNSRH
ncbi:MAG: PucR family transcriptional regulator [Solirubrobacterales bacterium]